MAGGELGDLIPKGPVLTPAMRQMRLSGLRSAKVQYEGDARISHPVLPLQCFGLSYDLDLAIASKHPHWNMHEFALLRTPEGDRWLAKDATQQDLNQVVTADFDGLDVWLPELLVPRFRKPVKVDFETRNGASGEPQRFEFRIEYTNPIDEVVRFVGEGILPHALKSKRNASTMGHSRALGMVVLDLSHQTMLKRAEIQYNGRTVGMRRIAGVVPFAVALRQVQAGICVGTFQQHSEEMDWIQDDGAATGEEVTASRRWYLSSSTDRVVARQSDSIRELVANYDRRLIGGSERLELRSLSVQQWNVGAPVCHVAFDPALPDLRAPFSGAAESTFALDVGGQESHAVGTVRTRSSSEADGRLNCELELRAERPDWVADRPLRALVSIDATKMTSRTCIQRM